MSRDQTLIVVGSGIGGMMTAYYAMRAGFKVRIVAKSSDPRRFAGPDPHSSTFGGEDARFITLSEGHPYLGKLGDHSTMYPDMQSAFTTPINMGGWLAKNERDYSSEAQTWLKHRFVENEDANAINRSFENYIDENSKAIQLWTQLIRDCPKIFRGVDLHVSGILRLYDNDELLEKERVFYLNHRVLQRILAPEQLRVEFPMYAEACTQGVIAGGLVVDGITIRVQQFIRNLIGEMSHNGVEFDFNQEVLHLQRGGGNTVSGLITRAGLLNARHYALYPGAYDSGLLLEGTPAEDQIAGVAGTWLRMPVSEDIKLPAKVHRGRDIVDGNERPTIDLNISTIVGPSGQRLLLIGGGYLFVGKNPFELTQEAELLMASEIHRVTKMYLGSAYLTALSAGTLKQSERMCVRSFTPNDAELDVVLPTSGGGIATIGGGGNTGTTTKAPLTAVRAVQRMQR